MRSCSAACQLSALFDGEGRLDARGPLLPAETTMMPRRSFLEPDSRLSRSIFWY